MFGHGGRKQRGVRRVSEDKGVANARPRWENELQFRPADEGANTQDIVLPKKKGVQNYSPFET